MTNNSYAHIFVAMSPMLFLRKNVLKVTQTEMGRLTGTSQATVSRWEAGELEPNISQLRAVRDAAFAAGVEWNDSWLLEPPKGLDSFHSSTDVA